jgi:hypothetical protein
MSYDMVYLAIYTSLEVWHHIQGSRVENLYANSELSRQPRLWLTQPSPRACARVSPELAKSYGVDFFPRM